MNLAVLRCVLCGAALCRGALDAQGRCLYVPRTLGAALRQTCGRPARPGPTQVLQNGFNAALLAGAGNLGITNWLSRVKMDENLRAAMHNGPTCKAKHLVGVFIHLDSCAAWHGMQ